MLGGYFSVPCNLGSICNSQKECIYRLQLFMLQIGPIEIWSAPTVFPNIGCDVKTVKELFQASAHLTVELLHINNLPWITEEFYRYAVLINLCFLPQLSAHSGNDCIISMIEMLCLNCGSYSGF